MRIREAAQELGISRESLAKLEKEGLIQPLRSRGGHRFYPPAILEAARQAFFPAEPKIHTPPAGFTKRNVDVT
jgi:hypothetical protein